MQTVVVGAWSSTLLLRSRTVLGVSVLGEVRRQKHRYGTSKVYNSEARIISLTREHHLENDLMLMLLFMVLLL